MIGTDHPNNKHNPTAYRRKEDHGPHAIVASEPSTYKANEWSLIEKNHCLAVEKDCSVRLEAIEYPKDWDATKA